MRCATNPNPDPHQACAPFALRFWHVLPAMRPQHSPSALLEEHKLDRLKVVGVDVVVVAVSVVVVVVVVVVLVVTFC